MACACDSNPQYRQPLAGLGAAQQTYTPEALAQQLAKTEESLKKLRENIIYRQAGLRQAGVLESAVQSFNRLRSRYAQDLTLFTAKVLEEYRRLDELQGNLTFGLWTGKRADKFLQEMQARLGTTDPGLALLETMPPIRYAANTTLAGLRGLGALPATAIVALAIGAAALAVGVAIKLAGDALLSSVNEIDAQTNRERAYYDAIDRCKGNELCLQAVMKADPTKPPPGKKSPWGAVIGVGVALAAVAFWPRIKSESSKRIARVNAG